MISDEQVARWGAALDAALGAEEDTDLEPLWNEVTESIEANPDHAGLRRLRIRMAEAFSQHATQHEDLVALHRLDPTNRADWLELAVLQHRWAYHLVPDEAEEEAGDDGDSEDMSISVRMRLPSGEGDDTPHAALEREARGWLAQMLREHRSDAGFCADVFARWSDTNIYSPWLRLTLALEVAATHPDHPRLARELASAWEDLSNQSPEGLDPEQPQLPMGFLCDVTGTLWDPFLQERALAAYARLLERDPDDHDLLARRARLLEARCNFAAAAEAYEVAQRSIERASAATSDDETREGLALMAADMEERARLCLGGRAAISEAMMSGLSEAVAKLQEPFPRREDASEAAEAFAANMDQTMRSSATELGATLETMRSTLPEHGVRDEQVEEMRKVARQVAGKIVGGLQVAPLNIVPITPKAFEQDWAETLRPTLDAFAVLGWHHAGWAEWPDFRAMLGHQAVSSAWVGPDGATVALAFSAKGMLSLDLETELEGGHILASSLSRGRNFMGGGPEVDTLLVEPALSIADACALHAARVAEALARSGRALKSCRDMRELASLQERARQRKTRFRLDHGLSESEALGVPHDYPEIFGPLLREAVGAGVAALRGPR